MSFVKISSNFRRLGSTTSVVVKTFVQTFSCVRAETETSKSNIYQILKPTMAEPSEEGKETAVTAIRENVKENIRIARLRRRQDEVDNFRITLGDSDEHSINLQSFNANDVLAIAIRIKKKRSVPPSDLMKLSHAFLQSTENINCFVNTSGAVPVIIKEATGTKTDTQILAIECLCNLSLGSETSSEKIAQRAATYLHTFLQSSNESLVRTSLWCLTNLIVAGRKPLNILLSQELIKALINVTKSSHSQSLRDDSYVAIELVLDHGGMPRSSDIETLSSWILSHSAPLDAGVIRIVYKLLNLLNYQSNDVDGVKKLVQIFFDTLIHLQNQFKSSTPESSEFLHQVVLLMRICSNVVALESSFGEIIIENWFNSQNRSLALFFNYFIELFAKCSLSPTEIYWFIGNLMKCPLSESTQTFVELDDFFNKINTDFA